MSKVKIQGNASGTGVLTVTAPNTSTDRTITLPDATGTLATTADVPSSITDNGDATAITIDSSEKVALGGSGSVSSDSQVAIKTGNLELETAGAKYWIPRASDGALTGSLYSPSGSVVRLSGAGTSAGTIEFEPRSSNGVIARVTGDGICFGSDTAAANALDDYEEGTFTATIHNATTSGGIDTGVYIRVGRLCHFQYYTGAMSFSSVGGTARISGLPFTMESLHTAYSVFPSVHGTAVTDCAGFHGDVNGNSIFAVQNDSTAYRPWVAGTKYLMVGGTYIIKNGS